MSDKDRRPGEHAIVWAGRLDAAKLAAAAKGHEEPAYIAPVVDLAEWVADR